MLALVPKLRTAVNEKELSPAHRPPLFPSDASAVLQKAVASTDRRIDQLAYQPKPGNGLPAKCAKRREMKGLGD